MHSECGLELASHQLWSDALAAFQEAAAARDAPKIQFNIGYCERALGRYAAARRTLLHVLANPAGLDATQVADASAYLTESESILVRVSVRLEPSLAALTVDGRALVADDAARDTVVAGLGQPGVEEPMNRSEFIVVLDLGAHLFRATRPGHEDAVVNRSYRSDERASLDLRLDLLPATVMLRSEPAQAIVTIDKRELGVAPLEFQRGAGNYRLEVSRQGFDTYHTTLDLQPGQHVDLTAKLNQYTEPLTKKWWFWTGAGLVLAGGAALTYALTRPAPQPLPYEAGSAGWLVHAQAVRW